MRPSWSCPVCSTSTAPTREKRHAGASGRARAAAGLLVVGLQQRLLSSIEAFARSLEVHRKTVERHWRKSQQVADAPDAPAPRAGDPVRFLKPPDADDERADWTGDEIETEEKEQIEAITLAAEAEGPADADAALWAREQQLLDRMQAIAEETRHLPDAKTRRLIDWIREHQCPELPPFGERPTGDAPPRWNARRVLIFTENREGTKRYLRDVLDQAIEFTDRAEERIEVIDGLTSGARRKEIQRRFNADPMKDPLRILIATDAAREGLNFQAHCADLFHFDLPWNPGRIEQRNGRIDRKLQPAREVNCHYFVLPQREEDRVLEVLVKKTETIKQELGSLAKVIDDDVERRLRNGIRHRDAGDLRRAIEAADLDEAKKRATAEELEAARDRQAVSTGRSNAAATSSRLRGHGRALGQLLSATPCRARWSCWTRRRWPRAGMRRAVQCGRFRRSNGAPPPIRAGPRPWTRSARPVGSTRSSPTGAGTHASGRWSSTTPAS